MPPKDEPVAGSSGSVADAGRIDIVAETPEIIIINKKSGHGGHHGGAWKVAYADFVTGMMALFIVLWLMNASKPIQTGGGRVLQGSARDDQD